ncbi:MAG: hypothetical protein V3R16_09655 [Nitrospirales bacterium]
MKSDDTDYGTPDEHAANLADKSAEEHTQAVEYKDVEPTSPTAGYAMSTGARLEMRRMVKKMFTYHRPVTGGNQERRYKLIRDLAMDMAETIYLNTPRCADQSAAIRKLRESVMTANAAIALDGAV